MKTYSLYIPRDFPTYEQEPDFRFEQRVGLPCVHQGAPEPSREPRVPQVEFHPGPPYRSLPKIGGLTVLGMDVASDCQPEVRAKLEQWARDFNEKGGR